MHRPPEQSNNSTAPFGSRKRDWTFIWRAVVFILSAFSAASIGIVMYAANSYIKAEAAAAIDGDIALLRPIPARIIEIEKAIEERKMMQREYADWRIKKDEVDIRLTLLLEGQQAMASRQQVQLDKQSDLINQLAQRRN